MGELGHSLSFTPRATAGGDQWATTLSALESVPEPVLLIDADERIVFVNQHVVHWFGFTTAELVGRPLTRLIPAGLRSRDWRSLSEFVQRGHLLAASVDASVQCNGGPRWRALADLFRVDAAGRTLALCRLREFVTPRSPHAPIDVDARLKEAPLAKIGSWRWDLATDQHSWSDEMYRMLQIDCTTDRPFDQFLQQVHPADRERIAAATARVAKGESLVPSDVRILLPDGTQRTFVSHGVATFDASGRAVQLQGTLQDITEQQETAGALRLTDMRYREAQRIAKIGSWEWDLTTDTSWWSDELYRIIEENRESYPATFENFIVKIHPADRQVLIDGQRAVDRRDIPSTDPNEYRPVESRLLFADGREKIVEQLIQVRRDGRGKPIAIVGTIHDITERRTLESKLRESEARYASTVELAAVGIAHIGLDGRFLWSNGRLRDMLGYTDEELLARTIWDISHREDVHMMDHDRQRSHAGEIDTLTFEKRYLRKDGALVWVKVTGATRRDDNGAPLYDVAILEDITARKAAEARVRYLATHDELTNLPNRTLFGGLLEHAIHVAESRGTRLGVLFVDLDRFKLVNDSLGHEAGDLLLQEVATRLREGVGKSGVVARLGGDEFVVLLEDLPHAEAAADIARTILTNMLMPLIIMRHECRVTVSIGIALYPADARDATTLMKHADMAMYLAKDEGKNNFQFYSADATPMSVERLDLEVRLANALQRGEFSLQYQPRIDIATGEIRGVEALLRWWNPDFGTLPPSKFVPLAEDTGLIVAIGAWVLRTACEQNVAWQKRGLPAVVISVNLSPRQFKDPALLDAMAAVLADTGMAPELLELEITESMLMHHLDIAAEKAEAMKKLGVRLAIDDFGTGYSSLSQLKRFPIDTLKIDRAFVRDIPESEDDTAITRAVISLGKALGVRVVAEGVETGAQYEFLRHNGCDEIQGFYVSKPCHPDAFADLLKRQVRVRRTE